MRYDDNNPPPDYIFFVETKLLPLIQNGKIIQNAYSYDPHIEWCKKHSIDFWVQPSGQNSRTMCALSVNIFFKTEEDAFAFKMMWFK